MWLGSRLRRGNNHATEGDSRMRERTRQGEKGKEKKLLKQLSC
jgi:hypothetical protein